MFLLQKFLGWMLIINITFMTIGLLKIMVFNQQVVLVLERLFGDTSGVLMTYAPKVLMIYWILIIVFNLVPYIAILIVY